MSITIIFTTTLLAFCAFLIILLVLLQNPKEEGQGILGGGMGIQNIIGVVRVASWIEKATYTLALSISVLSLLTAYLINQEYGRSKQSALVAHLEQYEGSSEKNN